MLSFTVKVIAVGVGCSLASQLVWLTRLGTLMYSCNQRFFYAVDIKSNILSFFPFILTPGLKRVYREN